MCLAIPAQVRTINENNLAVVDILGVTREVALDLTPCSGGRFCPGSCWLCHRSGKRGRRSGNARPDQADSRTCRRRGIIGGRFRWICLLSKIQSLPVA